MPRPTPADGNTRSPRVMAIHDLSCFGRAALTVVIPILSCMGIQVCPLPTALLSTHGGFSGHSFIDLTESVQEILKHWRSLKLRFDAVYSGYLSSTKQVDIFSRIIQDMSLSEPLVAIDPVLGDHGHLYGVTHNAMLGAMREYIGLADIITPNLTEAAFLLDEPYKESFGKGELQEWLYRLSERGPEHVVMTSVPESGEPDVMATLAYERRTARCWKVVTRKIPANVPGSGDAFTSVLLGSVLQGHALSSALEQAVQFLATTILATFAANSPACEGLLLEQQLERLNAQSTVKSREI